MKRPLCVAGFSYAITMFFAFYFDGAAALILSVAAAVTGLLFCLLNKKSTAVALVFFSTAASLGVYSYYHGKMIAPFLRAEEHIVTIEGLVENILVSGRAVDYTLEARFPKVSLPDAKIQVRSYGERQVSVGDTIRCKVKLLSASSPFYRNRGILARGTAETAMTVIELPGYAFSRYRLDFRAFLERNLYAKLPVETADVLGTMTLNIGSGINSGVYSHMNRSGISHILSISGLHFSILAAFLLGIFRGTAMPRRMPELLTVILSLAFVAVTGFSPSILRAFLMFLIMMLGQISYRRGDSVNSLGFALLPMVSANPQWTQSISMWLSVFSTLGILLMGQRLSAKMYSYLKGNGRFYNYIAKVIADSAGISLGAYLFTMPLLMAYFGWITLVALPANILVTPFVMPMLLGGLFCALVPDVGLVSRAVAGLTDLCVRAMLAISELLSDIPFAIISLNHAWMLLWLLGVTAMAAVLLRFRGTRQLAAWAAMFCVCSFCLGNLSALAAERNSIELVTLENCGPALLLRGGEAVILGTPNRYEVAALLNYMDFRGVRQVSALIASDSGDSIDSGILRLADSYPPSAVIGPDDAYVLDLLARALKGIPIYPSGYATTQALDCATVRTDKLTHDIWVSVGEHTIYKGGQENLPQEAGLIHIHNRGMLTLPGGISPVLEPVGGALFGETRLVLRLT